MRLPWKKSDQPTGGHEARVRAEKALAEAKARRPVTEALLTITYRDLERNHYRERIESLMRGGKA